MSARRVGRVWMAVATVVLLVAACGGGDSGDGSQGGGPRPTTKARLQILEPTANQVTGPDTTVRLSLTGGQITDRTTGPLTPEEGHVHVKLDGQLISMSYGLTEQLKGLTPGPHTVQADFVAVDHAPFANPVVAAVVFNVQ